MTQPTGSGLLDILGAVIDSLRRAKAPYMMIGGWSLAVWGRPRATMDLDFMLLLEEEALSRTGNDLIPQGFSLDEAWLSLNPLVRGLQLRMEFRGFTVDLMRPRDSHDRCAFSRRKKKRLAERYCWLAAPDDFILQKLKVGRPRDFEDALTVLERSRKILDFDYLEQWAGRLGVTAELHYLLGE